MAIQETDVSACFLCQRGSRAKAAATGRFCFKMLLVNAVGSCCPEREKCVWTTWVPSECLSAGSFAAGLCEFGSHLNALHDPIERVMVYSALKDPSCMPYVARSLAV